MVCSLIQPALSQTTTYTTYIIQILNGYDEVFTALTQRFRHYKPMLRKAVAQNFLVSSPRVRPYIFLITQRTSLSTMAAAKPTIFDNIKVEAVPGVLKHAGDRYDGVVISTSDLPSDGSEFQSTLATSLEYWRNTKRRGIWLKIPISKSNLIAPAVECGFVFHHAEHDYLMLNHWLSTDENRMPANCTHQVGVGCVIVHQGKLLLVQEKNGPLRGMGVWKLPTGLSDAGEDLCDAAVREVLEETGVKTEFVSILSIRQSHTALFGKSDLFFICLLKPKTLQIHPQAAEIVACEWIDAEVYLKQPFFLKSPLFSQVHEQLRETIQHISNDPTWEVPTASAADAANNTTGGSGDDNSPVTVHVNTTATSPSKVCHTCESEDSSVAVGVSTVVPPFPSLVVSRLPNGIRPGSSVLYHFPVPK